jgi:hypothetical protein
MPLLLLTGWQARVCREKGQKIVHLDVALAMWDLLLPVTRWPHAEAWKEFLRTHHKRAISRDTWNQLLDFMLVRGGCPCQLPVLALAACFSKRLRTSGTPRLNPLLPEALNTAPRPPADHCHRFQQLRRLRCVALLA